MAGLPTTAGAAVLAATTTANPIGWGLIAGGALMGGLSGLVTSNTVADLQSQSASVQNEIFREQFNIDKANMMQQRRKIFRQGQVNSAALRASATSSGSFRSSSFGSAKEDIVATTQQNIGQIDKAIEVGERITTLNQQKATLEAKAAAAQAQGGFLSSIFG
jgi:hypothetical protein